MDRRLLEYIPELELPDIDGAPPAAEAEDDVLADETEMALAAELLEVSGAAELESYLADLVAKVNPRGAAGLRTALGQAVLGLLKRAVRPMLPIRSSGAGGATQGAAPDLKTRAARIFGIEIEGMSPEDKEFEVARHVVRFAAGTVINAMRPGFDGAGRNLGAAGGGGADAPALRAKAQAALALGARHHAPGLLAQAARAPAQGSTQGRWQRQGDRIIVLDC